MSKKIRKRWMGDGEFEFRHVELGLPVSSRLKL